MVSDFIGTRILIALYPSKQTTIPGYTCTDYIIKIPQMLKCLYHAELTKTW